ncbi:MAG: hypothetical protein II440_03160 [Clostridia bacterium]|nr:hypothetical protein [Clostridia bacterium]
MPAQVLIMGMIFNLGSAPDFGSIYMVSRNADNVNEYGLDSADVQKLSLITNCNYGSTALCDDTGGLYRYTKSGWVLFGAGEALS